MTSYGQVYSVLAFIRAMSALKRPVSEMMLAVVEFTSPKTSMRCLTRRLNSVSLKAWGSKHKDQAKAILYTKRLSVLENEKYNRYDDQSKRNASFECSSCIIKTLKKLSLFVFG